jgi:uncharacterized membrane protein YvbJ
MANIKCPACGSDNVVQIDANTYQCPYCGKTFSATEIAPQAAPQYTQQAVPPQQSPAEVDDKPTCLMNGICFLIPIVGIILYFVKKNEQPNCAKSYLQWALISVAIGILINIFA